MTSLESRCQQFLRYLQQVRQLSPHTLDNYRRDLNSLSRFCQQQQLIEPDQIYDRHIRQWVAQLHRRGLASSSIQRSLSAARSFFNYLSQEYQHYSNPAVGISAPRKPRKLPKTLDADQVGQFLNFNGDSDIALRDCAMAELFYSSGLRLAELVAIDLPDIDRSAKLVTVTGKGNKTRTVPIGSVALAAIDAWLKVRPQQTDDNKHRALFTTRRGSRISARNIQARLKLQGRKSGMLQDVHPHMLRHSFASHMLESSGDLRAVQELLGHANISTTQIYTHLDFQHLSKVYDKAHPRAKKRKHTDHEK